MVRQIGIALGAGAASALLVKISGMASLAAMALAYVTPLPILIAALGFGHVTGGLAALFAGATVTVLMGPVMALIYLVVLALPAWWLGYVALLARPQAGGPGAPAASAEWYPIPKIVSWLAVCAALPMLMLGAAVLVRFGGFDAAVAHMAGRLQTVLGDVRLPEGFDASDLVRAAPVALAASAFLMLAINLWIGARIVKVSDRLARPWPSVARELRLPKGIAAAFAVAVGSAFLPDPVGVAAQVVGAALGMAFFVEGLATAHDLTRGVLVRRLILGGLYLTMARYWPWAPLAVALLGCLDCLFPLRRHLHARPILPTPRS